MDSSDLASLGVVIYHINPPPMTTTTHTLQQCMVDGQFRPSQLGGGVIYPPHPPPHHYIYLPEVYGRWTVQTWPAWGLRFNPPSPIPTTINTLQW